MDSNMYKARNLSNKANRIIIAAGFLFLSLMLALFSLVNGTSLSYVAVQALFFFILACIFVASRGVPLIVNLLILVALIKNFALSQFMKAFLLQPADVGLRAPIETALTMVVAAFGTLMGVLILGPFYRRSRWRGFAPSAVGLTSPMAIGYLLSAIGLSARLVATISMLGGQGSAILIYLGEVTFLGTASLVYGTLRKSNGARLWSFW